MLTAYPTHANAPGRLHEAVWIDLVSPTDEEVAAAEAAIGLKIPSREEVSAIEASSRLQRVNGALRLSTPLLTTGDAAQLSPVGFVLSATHLATVRFDRFGAFDTAVVHALEDGDPITSLGVFTCVLESIVDRVADLLEASAAELDQVSRGVFHQKHRHRTGGRTELRQRQVLVQVGRSGERLSHVRDVLLGVGRIAAFVLEVRHHAGAEAGPVTARLNAVRQDILSLNDYEAHLASKVQFLLDAVLGFITISQNDIFKVLTVWSIAGIPPTVVVGIYGMNFKYMPELSWTFGYPMGLFLVVVSVLVPLALFKWKGWV
jgi:magnesium transporter